MITFNYRRPRNLALLLLFSLFLLFLAWTFFGWLRQPGRFPVGRRLRGFFKSEKPTESLSPAAEELPPDQDRKRDMAAEDSAGKEDSLLPAGAGGRSRGQDGWTLLPPPREITATFNFKFPASRLACRVTVAGRASPVTGQLIGYSQLKKLVAEALQEQGGVFLGDGLDKENAPLPGGAPGRSTARSSGESRALARLLAPFACRLLSLEKSVLGNFF